MSIVLNAERLPGSRADVVTATRFHRLGEISIQRL